MTRTAIALAFLCATAATTVHAQTAPMLSTLIEQLESKGYRVLEADTERTWLEIEAINTNGQRMELVVDATTGEILREHADE